MEQNAPPVDLERLLATNDVPLEDEATALEQAIAAERARADHIRSATMARLRSGTADRRLEALEEAEKTLKAYSTVLSAARRVPAEIIYEIFSQSPPHTRSLGGKTVETAPWRLGHICQRWRAVALADTRLWTSITLANSPTATRTCPPEMVETQLLRSGAVTLTVTIDCQTGGAKKDLLNSIKLCVAQSHRWATLSLQGQDFILGRIFPLLLPVQGRLNTLSKLELLSTLERPGAADPFAIPPDPDTLYNPLLSLGGTLHLPFAQLAYFHGFFPSQSQALKALRAARSMVKFAVSFVHVGASPPIVVILPKLRYLSVAAPEHSDFLSGVEAPGLEGLCVRDHADLPEFIQRSSCQLTKLVVHRCSEPGDLVDVLRSLPTLTTLFVGFASDVLSAETRPLFNALKARNGTTEVCPNLTHLAVDGPPEFGVNAFVEMAASRWFEVKPSPLVFVRVFRGLHTSTHARVPKRVLDCLRKMREEGLDAGFESRVDFSPESLLGFGTLKI